MPIDPRTRRAPTWLLILVAALLLPWSYFVNLWFAPRELYSPLLQASGGLLHPALQVCLPTILILLVLFRRAGLGLVDVGLDRAKLAKGCLATFVLWGLANLTAWVVHGGEPTFVGHSAGEVNLLVGRLLGQLFGNAFFEELTYRGLFLAQFVLIFRARGMGAKRAAWLAALGSALIFALPHIPNRLFKGDYDGAVDVLLDQLRLVLSGLFLAWIYLRTQNLWWVIGLHSLANYPSLLFEWELDFAAKGPITGFGLLITIAWPWIFGRKARLVPG